MGETNVERLLEELKIEARDQPGNVGRAFLAAAEELERAIEADRAQPPEGAVRVRIKRRTEPAFVRPKFVYEISAPTVLGGTLDDGEYEMRPLATDRGEDDGEPPPTRMERLMGAECRRYVNNGDILPREQAAFIMGWTACESAMREDT